MDIVLGEVTKDVRSSQRYSIVVDETADISFIEEVSICLRYVIECIIRETFIGFYPTETTEGSVLCELVQKTLSELHLDPAKIVGLCFDGAANMSGTHRGLVALMIEL